MSLNFAGIMPHPPIIIPEIGSPDDFVKAGATIAAAKKMAHLFCETEIDTLIVISPHMLTYPDKFSICGMKKLFGSFANFNSPDIMMDLSCDLNLAVEIDKKTRENNIDSLLYDNGGEFFELDHGLMVPLYYLLGAQESNVKIVPIAYSGLSRANHFSFGQIIGEVVKKFPSRVGIIASGDLSHRLINGTLEQISAGKEFDKKITSDLKNSNTKNILYYDEDFTDSAGECGYRSILILLGTLDGLNIKADVLSYEGPFGVGYLVANFKMNG